MVTKATAKKPQNSLLKPLGAFFRRFHFLLFFIVIVGCLAAAVLLINKTLSESPDEPYTSTISAGSIDQATLERIQSLHASNKPSGAPKLPEGRINPFGE
jgi:hypothetical protein